VKKDTPSAWALLLAARDFIDAIPPLALLNAPRRSGRMLVAKIDRLLSIESWRDAPEDAVAEARQRWQQEKAIRIDDSAVMLADAKGLWVSAWLLLEYPTCPIAVDRFKQALESLPPMPREAYKLHRIEGRTMAEVAQQLGLSDHETEAHMSEALYGLHTRQWRRETMRSAPTG
jgi:DNA-directed RNA polymerase specialized sigma24 family protein